VTTALNACVVVVEIDFEQARSAALTKDAPSRQSSSMSRGDGDDDREPGSLSTA
jgi:hypothetical protein